LTGPRLSIQTVLYTDDKFSIGKAALSLAMVENDFDDPLIELMKAKGYKAVITRAGGRGDNLKNKILRNVISAAEKSGIVQESVKNRYAITRCVEKAMQGIFGFLSDISGAGVKIGIVTVDTHIAIGIYGTVGIPGLDVDTDVCGLAVSYHVLTKST